MPERLGRGWAMARASFAVLRRFPALTIFPVISGAIFLAVAGLIVLSLLQDSGALYAAARPVWDSLGGEAGQATFYVVAFALLYGLTVVAIFCNVALIHCALRAHAGETPSVGAGLASAAGCLPQILGWALISVTVGLILNAIESALKDKLGFLGGLIGGLLEFGWAVTTYFVLPVLAAERLGPIAAIRRSSAVLRARWGESLAGEARFGLVGLLFFLLAGLVFFAGLALLVSAGGLAGLGLVLMALGVCMGLATIIVLQALSGIFQAGVYLYATTGQVPATLDPGLVQGAFRAKR